MKNNTMAFRAFRILILVPIMAQLFLFPGCSNQKIRNKSRPAPYEISESDLCEPVPVGKSFTNEFIVEVKNSPSYAASTINLLPYGTFVDINLKRSIKPSGKEHGWLFDNRTGGFIPSFEVGDLDKWGCSSAGFTVITAISEMSPSPETEPEWRSGAFRYHETIGLALNHAKYVWQIGGTDTSNYAVFEGTYRTENRRFIFDLHKTYSGGFYVNQWFTDTVKPQDLHFVLIYLPELRTFIRESVYNRLLQSKYSIDVSTCQILYPIGKKIFIPVLLDEENSMIQWALQKTPTSLVIFSEPLFCFQTRNRF